MIGTSEEEYTTVRGSRWQDITGERFGRLVAVRPNGKQGKNTLWLCKCDCGNHTITNISSLKKGLCKSCGCLRKENTGAMFRKHGHSKEKIFPVYLTMKARCETPNNSHYKYYGGKGIKVCAEWADSFEAFYGWSMANGYSEGLTIDRIDVNGNYEPANCRWVSKIVQANNKSNNALITYNGETHTIAEWAKILGLSYYTLYQRIKVHNWTLERAFTQEQRKRGE